MVGRLGTAAFIRTLSFARPLENLYNDSMAIILRKQKNFRLPVRDDSLLKSIAERKSIDVQEVILLLLRPGLDRQQQGKDPLPNLPDGKTA